MNTKVAVYPLKTTLQRHEIKTSTMELSFKDGASATILKTERVEEEQANPLLLIFATFFVFCSGTYCLIQTLKTSHNTYEIQSRLEQQPMETLGGNLYHRYR
ncbi:MAG: hypothetical protein KME30_31305 [Iphinoe sp. HA4291-MV1]|jgi:hypothetical protein|nr:hypothetical protein [Iphinoe sp. HA4291-MV1]